MMVLCLFGLSLAYSVKPHRRARKKVRTDTRIYLDHADELQYDMYGAHPDAQIARTFAKGSKGKVKFRHMGAILTCDSAYYYQESNSFEAFGHVNLRQGDTLTLAAEYIYYNGDDEVAEARSCAPGQKKRNDVILTHRKSKLYCDSLDYDRMYGMAYFFEGGKLVDKGNTLTSDWGQYSTETRKSDFFYNVRLRNKDFLITSDTLHYDNRSSKAHVTGPSVITNKDNVIHTTDGYYNTSTERSELYSRSTVVNGEKTITADRIFSNNKTKANEGFGNVVYEDKKNKNRFLGNHIYYDEAKGYGFATDSAVVIDFSQKDTLWMHADSIKMYSFNMNTDSIYRKVHAYRHVRAYRNDVQAVCDSLVFNSLDSCLTMYKDPIVWNMGRQVLGEVIHAYMNDSTVRYADVIGQALSVEKEDSAHFNQIASKEMRAYFVDGKPRESWSVGNVQVIYYPIDNADTTIISLNYLETDTLKMYVSADRKLEKIWANKSKGTWYPLTQVPPNRRQLPNFAWFDYIRPLNKDDIFLWRGKNKEQALKEEKRRAAPTIKLTN